MIEVLYHMKDGGRIRKDQIRDIHICHCVYGDHCDE